MRRREWAFRALAIVAALVLFEVAARALGVPRTDTCWAPKESYWLPDDALGFAYRPGAEVARGTINAIGLRGPVPSRDAGVERLLFVGDSSAYGFGVGDGASFWSLATQAYADARPGAHVEPIVAAAPGYGSYHSRVLVERFASYAPRFAIFYVGGYNDHRPRRYFADAEIPARMARRHAAWHDVRVLQSGELIANLVGGWITRRFGGPDERARVPVADFDANVRAMLDAATRAGARSIVLIPPVSPKLAAQRPTIPRYLAILRERAAEAGATVIELGPLFADPEVAFLRDQIHPSAVGHARIAAALTAALNAAE